MSVLFIDVVSFTRFVERSDPEQVRRMQSAFFSTVRQVIGRYNGLVEKYIGDAVMALFGAPVATETAVLGCVSAALELQRTLRRQADGDELSFGFRIGVATGEALVDTVAARDGGQAIAAGDVINTASRLQSAAPPGGVLVDGPTHAATADEFRYERREPVTLRGHTTPTELWVPVTQIRRRITARDQSSTPLVNRVHELSLLTGALNRMITDRLPQLVTLFGRAGIGKSRLVTELFRYGEGQSPGIRWSTGHCPPFGENVTYAAFADIVKTEAGILDSDDAATARVRLREAVSRLVPAAEADRLTNALGPLVGLPGQQLLAEDTESAWRRFVVALATDRPTVLVIEDLHWADQTMVSFVERLGAVVRDVPLLVLCTSRPELLEREPAWAAAIAGSQTISLSPMNDAHIADMYAALFGKATFPSDMLDKLVELAGGNPLYAHEYFRMLLEQGGLTGAAHGPAAAHPIPDNVHAVIANRLDLLDPDDRLVLQAASVLGVVFWPDAVGSTLGLSTGAVERALRRMEQRDLVREQESTREGQTEYRFSHVLVRDVCYQRLPRTERVAQHARIADWLEAMADTTGNRAEDLAEVVANHRYSAHEVARILHLDTLPYAPPARRALHRAARRAFRLHALDVAATHVTRALRLFGSDPGDDAADEDERHELELLDAELAFLRDSDGFLSGGGLERLDRLTAVLDRGGNLESAARAWMLRGHVAWMTADRRVAMDNLGRAIDRFAALPDSEAKADAHAELARLRLTSDEHLSAIEAAGVAAEIAGRLGLIEVRATAMITIGMGRYLLGEVEGISILEEALDTCRRLKLPSTRRVTRNLAVCLQEEGELDRAIALLAESELTSVGDGHSVIPNYSAAAHQAYLAGDWNGTLVANDALRGSPSGAWDLGSRLQSVWLRALRGETTDADRAEVDEVLHAGRESGFPRLTWTTLGQAALCRALLGAPDDCLALLTDLAASWLPLGSLPSGEWTAAAGHAAALLGGTAARTLSDMLDRSPRDTPWVRAARAAATGALAADDGDHATAAERHAEAAELYRRIGTRSDEVLSLAVAVREYQLADRTAEPQVREVRAFAAANGADRILSL